MGRKLKPEPCNRAKLADEEDTLLLGAHSRHVMPFRAPDPYRLRYYKKNPIDHQVRLVNPGDYIIIINVKYSRPGTYLLVIYWMLCLPACLR